MKQICTLPLLKALFISYLALSSSKCLYGQNDAQLTRYLQDSLETITHRVQVHIVRNRYMEEKLLYTVDTLSGYEGVKVSLFEYNFPARKNSKFTTQVYLLDADADRIARWIISACYLTTHKLAYPNTSKLIYYINNQSNGQFPVEGCVFENLSDTFQSPFIYFKDGVTVKVKDVVKNQFKFIDAATNKKSAILNLNLMTTGNLDKCYRYGRICSTLREQYTALGGKADTQGLNWLRIVREEYLKALKADSNFLITAWAKQNLKE